jgi:hypothetical protein
VPIGLGSGAPTTVVFTDVTVPVASRMIVHATMTVRNAAMNATSNATVLCNLDNNSSGAFVSFAVPAIFGVPSQADADLVNGSFASGSISGSFTAPAGTYTIRSRCYRDTGSTAVDQWYSDITVVATGT